MTVQRAKQVWTGVVFLLMCAAWPAEAVTVPGNYPTIQAAINAAASGALPNGVVIDVSPGTYTESLMIDTTNRSFTVRGIGGASVTVIRPQTVGVAILRVLRATGVIRFEGLTFTGGAGSAGNGGGLTIHDASPIIEKCIFDGNSAPQGGGALIIHSNPQFVDSIFRNNTATDGGGGVTIGVGSRATFRTTQIVNNRSGVSTPTGSGGGVHVHDSSAIFRGSTITNNQAKFAGGGIMHLGPFGSGFGTAILVLEDSFVEGNVATRFSPTPAFGPSGGGGVHIEDNAVAYVIRTKVAGNIADIAGGLSSHRARYDIQSSFIESNQAVDPFGVGGFGGGIGAFSNNLPGEPMHPSAVVSLRDTVVAGNTANKGGAIAISGDHLCGSSSCPPAGANRAVLSIVESLLDANSASQQAGGITADRTNLTITNSFVTNNAVTAANDAYGGGVLMVGTTSAVITGATIARNSANTIGGGLAVGDGSTVTVEQSRIYQNTSASGGGIYVGNDGSPSGIVRTSVIADNANDQIFEQACAGQPILQYRDNQIVPRAGGNAYRSICNPPGIRATVAVFNGLTGVSGNTAGIPNFAVVMVVPDVGPSRIAWSIARAQTVTISGLGSSSSDTSWRSAAPSGTVTYAVTATRPSGSVGPINAIVIGPVAWGAGSEADVPVPGDYDGDNRADLAVYRGTTGQWFVGTGLTVSWGAPHLGDLPIARDYDGDGRTDVAVYRSSTGEWFIRFAAGGSRQLQWGAPHLADQPVPADYDGDGKADIGIFRGATGQWIILNSSNGSVVSTTWGAPSLGDVPVPADYNGDGRDDIAVYRRSTGAWYLTQPSPYGATVQWGAPSLGDVPVPADYDGDGRADIAIAREWSGEWFILMSGGGAPVVKWGFGDYRIPADYNGSGNADVAVWRRLDGGWIRQP